jgi:hypothetical protein
MPQNVALEHGGRLISVRILSFNYHGQLEQTESGPAKGIVIRSVLRWNLKPTRQ